MIKVLVAVKHVIDPNVRIRVKPDRMGVQTSNVKMAMNPFDEIAVEEAVRMREAGFAGEVVVVTIGSARSQDALRAAMALGADRGILIETDTLLEPLALARILKSVVEQEQSPVVILGKQAIDDECSQTGQMLAALMGWAQGTFVSKLLFQEGRAIVTREVDGGSQTLSLKMPVVVTADLRLNKPRYASLPNIMEAKNKPLECKPITAFDVDVRPRLAVIEVVEPPPRRGACVMAPDAAGLLIKLRDEVGVI